jgi:hypothetical protein
MKRRVIAAFACGVFCAATLRAEPQVRTGIRETRPARHGTHHRPADGAGAHPGTRRPVAAVSRRHGLIAVAPCIDLDDGSVGPSCSEAAAADDQSKAAPVEAPVMPHPAPSALPSSIQPRPASLPPRAGVHAQGTLRLDAEPASAQVFVDGFYAGSVGEIDARGLALGAGWHRLVFRAPGYEAAAGNVTVQPNATTTFHLAWQPVR